MSTPFDHFKDNDSRSVRETDPSSSPDFKNYLSGKQDASMNSKTIPPSTDLLPQLKLTDSQSQSGPTDGTHTHTEPPQDAYDILRAGISADNEAIAKLLARLSPDPKDNWASVMQDWPDTAIRPGWFDRILPTDESNLDWAAFSQAYPSQSRYQVARVVSDTAQTLSPFPWHSLEDALVANELQAIKGPHQFLPSWNQHITALYRARQIEYDIEDKAKSDMGIDGVRRIDTEFRQWQTKRDSTFLDFSGPDSQPAIREYYDRIKQATVDYIKQHHNDKVN